MGNRKRTGKDSREGDAGESEEEPIDPEKPKGSLMNQLTKSPLAMEVRSLVVERWRNQITRKKMATFHIPISFWQLKEVY